MTTYDRRPGDNPNQCAQGYSCPPPTIVLDSFDTFQNRYVDVGAGGPATFTFSITANVSWIVLNTTHGEVSPEDPEQRVYISVSDWNALDVGDSYASITFTAQTEGQPDLPVPVIFVAHNTMPSLASGFSGAFVLYSIWIKCLTFSQDLWKVQEWFQLKLRMRLEIRPSMACTGESYQVSDVRSLG